MVTKNKIFL